MLVTYQPKRWSSLRHCAGVGPVGAAAALDGVGEPGSDVAAVSVGALALDLPTRTTAMGARVEELRAGEAEAKGASSGMLHKEVNRDNDGEGERALSRHGRDEERPRAPRPRRRLRGRRGCAGAADGRGTGSANRGGGG